MTSRAKYYKKVTQLLRHPLLTNYLPLQEAANLPKTRSGKIMRRVLRKIARDETDFGDISTLADPSVVEILQEGRKELFAPKK